MNKRTKYIAGVGALITVAAALAIYYLTKPQSSSASTGSGSTSSSSDSSTSSSQAVTTSSSQNAIYNAFVQSGYISALQGEGLTADVAAARQNPSAWLTAHPYLYTQYPNYFQE